MCKTYTWVCRACRVLQDITYCCRSSSHGPCQLQTPVAGLPPDGHYSTVTCYHCGHDGLPVDISSPPTCNDECNTSIYVKAAHPAQSAHQQPEIRDWGNPAAFHQTLQHQPHVTPPIDPVLLALDSTQNAHVETPAQYRPACSSSASDGFRPADSVLTRLPSQYQRPSSRAPESFLHASQSSHSLPHWPPYSQQIHPPCSTSLNRAVADMNKKRAEVFELATQTQRESRESGQREETPRAEELDRAWGMLCEMVMGKKG